MPILADFDEQLRKRSTPASARWMVVDLHNHSPASPDFAGDRSNALEDAKRHLRDSSLDVVMFVDHQKLPDSKFTNTIANHTGKTVLRGCEINIFVDAWEQSPEKIGKNAFFHLLVGFDPEQDPDYWFSHLTKECRTDTRTIGGTSISGFTDSIDSICDLLDLSGAIIVPAHLHTRNNALKSRSIDDIFTDPEFLRLANRFTALEVTQPSTAKFFDGQHKETNYLHKACIRSSDAHDIASIGNRVTYVQMQHASFSELRASLQIPFRVSLNDPSLPDSHVIGLNVRGRFFPDLWLSLSPYCNAFIGVKGSGKTSVLECLRFVLGAPVPESKSDDVEAHLRGILGEAGSVQVLVKRNDGAKVLIRRAINNRDVFEITFEDDRQEQVRNTEALMFPSYILGWHEIEQSATDPRIRQVYLDTIAGLERVRQLQDGVTRHTSRMRRLHEQAAIRYSQFRSYYDQVSRLEDLRSGLQQLDDAKLIALRDEFEMAVQQRQVVVDVVERLKDQAQSVAERTRILTLPIDTSVFSGSSPLTEIAQKAAGVVEGLNRHVAVFVGEHERRIDSAILDCERHSEDMLAMFREFAVDYEVRIAGLTVEQKALLESHRKVLEDTRTLPDLTALKEKEQSEVQILLASLIETCKRTAELLDAQTLLRTDEVGKLNEELGEYGVRLDVAPLSRNAVFEDLSQRGAAGASVFEEIRSFAPDEARHHRRLARAYERLRDDLVGGYRLFFESAEFMGYLEAFEEDDLWIGLKVGKEGQEYSPIDELSAGQRCTAVFPLLLKLQEGPLIVDQPEDNLDNRHISESVSSALLDDKRRRQIAFTSHNANLVVLTDCELITMFEGMGSTGRIEARGFLCNSSSTITRKVVEILDGGERALKLRYQKYGVVAD